MVAQGGVNLLVQAAQRLVAQVSDLRIWFVGDGPHRDWIYDQLRGDGLRASVAMPGSFCNLEDLYAAADVYVQLDDVGLDALLPWAVSAELPIVTVDTEAIRSVLPVSHDSAVVWMDQPSSSQLHNSVMTVLGDLAGFRREAAQLRRNLLRARPQSAAIEAYLQVMRSVASAKSGNGPTPPRKAIS